MKQTIIKTISFVLCGFILFGSSAVFSYAQDIDNTEISSYTESVNLYLSDSAIYLNKATPQSTNISAIIKTPLLIVLVRETPDFLGEVKTVFFIGTKVKIKETTGYYCLVETKSGASGYVFKGWLDKEDDNTGGENDEKYEFNRAYDHVYVDYTNTDSAGNPRSKIKNSGDKTVTYSTNNTSIISVDSQTGLITGKKPGVAKLIAKIGTKKVEIPVYCIYKWKKGWTGKTNKSTTIYSGTASSTATVASIPSGTKFCVQGDDGGSAGWAYGYADVAGDNDPWGFVKIGNISTKGTVSQYNNMKTTLKNGEKVYWCWPVLNEIDGVSQNKNANYISSPYAPRSDSTSKTIHHRGMDITTGTAGEIKKYSVVSAVSGTVKAIRSNIDSCGFCISISSDCTDPVTGQNIAIIYMHLYEVPKYSNGKIIQVGDEFSIGTIIGKVGKTNGNTSSNMGYHLHFEANNRNAAVGDIGRSDFTNTINPIYFYLNKSIRINNSSEACQNGYTAYWYNKNN